MDEKNIPPSDIYITKQHDALNQEDYNSKDMNEENA
jgi:hypothetical protein